MATRTSGLLVAVVFMTVTASALAQSSPEPIRYTLRFPAPQTHYVEVSAVVPTGGRPEVELMMAVWTPGSYLVREYARHVEAVAATGANGVALAVDKSDKNRWLIQTGGAATIAFDYRVYSREMSVRTNWVESEFALLNGAPTFMTLPEDLSRPHEVIIEPAAGWRRSLTGLPELGGGEHRYRAPDFDTLVDSPILVGNPDVYEFTVDGKQHYLVNQGEAGVFDGARAATDLETLVRAHREFWGSLPYDKYLFINMITESGGGLEHKNSTLLMSSRWVTRTRRTYLAWLDLASHEFFHAWNVKRLRPLALGPFDYENENFTRSLWMVEGITDYYAALVLHRAGLSTRDELLDALSDQIEGLQTTPGRLVQSVEMASFDAWIKYYRPNENSLNTAVSYYTKGTVLAFLLDAEVRRATGGARSLDDVMRTAFERFSGPRGFTPDDFRAAVEETAGTDLASFWATAVEGTAELDYEGALETLGLRFRPVEAAGTDRPGSAWLGVATRNDSGRLIVSQVRRDGPALGAGLNVDDEILAIDDFRVRADRLANRLEQYRPGDTVTFLVARREQLLRIEITFDAQPGRRWRLELRPGAGETAERMRASWLGSA